MRETTRQWLPSSSGPEFPAKPKGGREAPFRFQTLSLAPAAGDHVGEAAASGRHRHRRQDQAGSNLAFSSQGFVVKEAKLPALISDFIGDPNWAFDGGQERAG
jgi:hypothetical protein